MIARLISLAARVRDVVWGRPPNFALFLEYHPHLRLAEARRVLAYVHEQINYRGCPRTVDAVALAICDHFHNWFLDYTDAARHAAEALGYELVDHPTE